MEKYAYWTRRALHVALGTVIIYYLVPPIMFKIGPYSLSRDIVLILLYLIPLGNEIQRHIRGTTFFLLREHEKTRVASYLWFATGAVALILLFPQYIAAPCIIATAIGDPVMGETRHFRRRYTFSIAFLVCILAFLIFQYPLPLTLFAGAVTFMAESIEFKIEWKLRSTLFYSRSKQSVSKYKRFFGHFLKTDDDFVMQIIPAMTLMLTFFILVYYERVDLLPPLDSPLLKPLFDSVRIF